MSQLRIERVLALPETKTASTLYIVQSADASLAEVVFTSTDGSVARRVINKDDVQTLINSAIGNFNNLLVADNIAARDVLTFTKNTLVLVADATGDATVTSGAALYFYNINTTTFTKVYEYESLDVTLSWASIQGKPASAIADIDDAVAKRHQHVNAAQLDKVGQDAEGNLTYNGLGINANLAVANW